MISQCSRLADKFNAKCEEWFASRTNSRGALLSEFATANGTITMNRADPTRFHQGSGSHIDVTFASESLTHQIKGWAVLEEESGSNHNYICFTVDRRGMVSALIRAGRWAINKLDPYQLENVILASEWHKDHVTKEISVEMAAQKLVQIVTAIYDATTPRQCRHRKIGNVFWWMEEIAHLKSKANQSCQQYQCMRGREAG